jgi:hypothetical protein
VIPVELQGVRLTGRPFDVVIAELAHLGFDLELDDAGAFDRRAGIGLSRNAEDGVESIVIIAAED